MFRWFPIVVAIAMVTGCSHTKDLSRDTAAKILEKAPEFQKQVTELPWLDQNGEREWLSEGGMHNDGFRQAFAGTKPYVAVLPTPVKRSVSLVTGIVDFPLSPESTKEVMFEWTIPNLPSVAKRFVVSHGTGKAVMRRFDDGWRLEGNVNLENSREKRELTTSEKKEISRGRAAESARQHSEKEQNDRKTAEHQKVIEESKKRTKDLLTLTGVAGPIARRTTADERITVTDVDIRFPKYSSTSGIWLGNVTQIDLDEGDPTWCSSVRITYMEGQGRDHAQFSFNSDADTKQFYTVVLGAHKAWREKWASLVGH